LALLLWFWQWHRLIQFMVAFKGYSIEDLAAALQNIKN
jgi:hypothetical protein